MSLFRAIHFSRGNGCMSEEGMYIHIYPWIVHKNGMKEENWSQGKRWWKKIFKRQKMKTTFKMVWRKCFKTFACVKYFYSLFHPILLLLSQPFCLLLLLYIETKTIANFFSYYFFGREMSISWATFSFLAGKKKMRFCAFMRNIYSSYFLFAFLLLAQFFMKTNADLSFFDWIDEWDTQIHHGRALGMMKCVKRLLFRWKCWLKSVIFKYKFKKSVKILKLSLKSN